MKLLLPGFILLILFSFYSGFAYGEDINRDMRLPFDKKPYMKTVWSMANPWFPPNLTRTHQHSGGPDYSWWKLSEDDVTMWSQVAEKMQPYGITGLQMEIMTEDDGQLGWDNVFRSMLDGFALAGNDFKVQPFVNNHSASVEGTIKGLQTLMPLLLKHPNIYRLNGSPVISFYGPHKLTPEQWHEVITTIEGEFGRVIWLLNAHQFRNFPKKTKYLTETIRRYLHVFDGITVYANWSEQMQITFYEQLSELMKHFPQKIFEGAVHTAYTVHFHYGGTRPKLTEKFRNSWQITLQAKPDSVTVTNFFDVYENTRIFPSYELEDIRMKITQFEIAKWRGEEPAASDYPDLYVTNFTNIRIGEPIRFEVIGFPISGDEKKVEVTLEVCDAQANVLHRFDTREMSLDEMSVEIYSMESEGVLEHRAVYPRLKYCWHRQEKVSYLFPQTNLVTGMRPHMLFWARSVKRMIKVDFPGLWSIEGKGPGETATYPEYGTVVMEGKITPEEWKKNPIQNNQQELPKHGGSGRVRILRNGREIENFTTAYTHLNFTKPISVPNPGGSLDWYNMELENEYGRYGTRYLTPSIWLTSGKRKGEIILPILSSSGKVKEVQIEAVRVPYFYYRCDKDTGQLLLDSSGYEHHGYLGGKGFGGGHFGFTGYRHEHIPLKGIPAKQADAEGVPQFKKDDTGQGYLHFTGKDYVMMQGGTAFPYAYTYEMYIKPEAIGSRQGIMGAANRSIKIYITEDGHIEAQRRGEVVVKSVNKISSGSWTHISVVYDLKELTLYINGKKQATAEVKPIGYEMSNVIVLGGICEPPYNPKPTFKGGIKQVRFYGRNLKPDEFLLTTADKNRGDTISLSDF